MAGGDPSEFITAIERRGELLRELADGPTGKHELDRRLGVSRSTIDRGVRELEEIGLVERADGGYRQTLPGRLTLSEYDRFQDRVAGLCDGTDLLAAVEPDADMEPAMLSGAQIVEATRSSPQRPVEMLYEVVERATSVRGFAPAIHPQQVETYRGRIVDDGMAAEIVVTDAALERLVTDYAEAFEEALACDHVTFWESDAEMPYSVTLAETSDGTYAGLLVYSEHGILGCALNDSPAAIEWAEARFERELERSTQVA